jgi:hypothetical protein
MASIAQVQQQDPQYPGTKSATRLSASLYEHFVLVGGASLDQTFVVGSITRHPTDSPLISFLDEAVYRDDSSDTWGRIEVLQRLASELEIPTASTATVSNPKRWVSAVSLGYTHWSSPYRNVQIGLGSSLTLDVVPNDWAGAYGSRTPLTVRVIVQVRGAGRWQR